MSRFGPDPKQFFTEVYTGPAPWDLGAPQPALMALIHEFPPSSPILDVGCGSGDLAIALACKGYEVTGIDFVPAAIRLAKERAASLEAPVRDRLSFEVADGMRPSRLGRMFGAIVDSGFFHLFDSEAGDRFIDDIARALAPSGRYYVLAFATEFPIPFGPRAVSQQELRERFSAAGDWRVLKCVGAEFLNRAGPPVPSTAACVERVAST